MGEDSGLVVPVGDEARAVAQAIAYGSIIDKGKHICPMAFAVKNLHRDGRPYVPYRRIHLNRPYNDPYDLLLKCSRQTEKSTLMSNKAGMYLYGGYVTEPDGGVRPLRALYFTASMQQAQDFSKDRLARVLESPCFTESWRGGLPLWPKERNTRNYNYVDQIYEKQLRSRAVIKLRACNENADRVRGLSNDVLFGDEIQDIHTDLFPVIEESAARSPIRKKIYAGTPLTFDNAIEERWRVSTQYEWEVMCEHCNFRQHLTEKNIGLRWFRHIESGCICAKCGKPMDPQNGAWRAHGKPDALLHGYRICHIMLPQDEQAWAQLLWKRENYEDQQFHNEVLGFSHEHANQMISMENLFACCDSSRRAGVWPDHWTGLHSLAAGIDWGGAGKSATVLTIGGFVDDKFRVLFQKNYKRFAGSRDDIIAELARIIISWGVRVVGTDYGGGVKENQDLQLRLYPHCKVVPFQYSGNTVKETAKLDVKGHCWIVSRSKTLGNLFNMIGRRQIEFFSADDMHELKEGYIYEYGEYNTKTRLMQFDHPESRPDDELHSLNYVYMASAGQTGWYGIKIDHNLFLGPV